MSRLPPSERPSARALKAASGSVKPLQIAGKPADVCPYCGCALFVNGTRHPSQVIRRNVRCRNANCGRKFESQQPPAILVREIGIDDNSSSSGQEYLTIHHEAG